MQYDPSLEWPGAYDESTEYSPAAIESCLRLAVRSSAVLAPKRKVAVLDAYTQAEIGRDVSSSHTIPRIRLKDMEVSKVHATLFWDAVKKCWAVVDMGSKHGTFVKPTSSTKPNVNDDEGDSTFEAAPQFKRLSAERQASLPYPLHHLDELSVGSTVFVIHVHSDRRPCDECKSQGDLDIPLFSGDRQNSSQSGKLHEQPQKVSAIAEVQDAKGAISQLRRKLLSQHSEVSYSSEPSQKYIDRAAKRRALHPYSRTSSPPGISLHHDAVSSRSLRKERSPDYSRYWDANSSGFTPDSSEGPPLSTYSTDSASTAPPISSTSIGHRMLTKQGWTPGGTLGTLPSVGADEEPQSSRLALTEPLQPVANIGRKGLGAKIS